MSFDYRVPRGFQADNVLHALGGDYLELDEVLASGAEVAIEEDATGYLLLIESGESE
jgi:hypothetical protein